MHLVRNAENLGWSGGNNTGIRFALERGADVRHPPEQRHDGSPATWSAGCSPRANAHPDFGVIGPVIRYMDEPDAVMTDGVAFNRPD